MRELVGSFRMSGSYTRLGKRANWKWDIQKHMKTEHPGLTDEVICLDNDEAKATLDEYLKDHPEQRGKPRVAVPSNHRPEHWPKPRVGVCLVIPPVAILSALEYM